jgi:integral membrane protein (TIGR01906 family)
MKKAFLYYTVEALFCLCFVVAALFTAIEFVAFDENIFLESLRNNDVADTNTFDLNQEQLDYVMRDVLNYLKDGREDLDTVVQNEHGTYIHVFIRSDGNDVQVSHMRDVKRLFSAGRVIRLVCAILLLPLFFARFPIDGKRARRLLRLFLTLFIVNIAVIGTLAIIVAVDFHSLFVVFHKLIFTNDDWLLYYDDMLIQLLGDDLFASLFLRVGAWFVGLTALPAAIAGGYRLGVTLGNKGKRTARKKHGATDKTVGNIPDKQ